MLGEQMEVAIRLHVKQGPLYVQVEHCGNICLTSGVNINGLVHRFKVKWPQKENNLELRVFQIQLAF